MKNNQEQKVCLYIATHNKTGLKYFGKTKRYFTEVDLLKYGGSGIYWNRHIKIHGKDISMKIYGIYNIEDVKAIALKFSTDNNIVNENGKKVWANEIIEDGLDAGGTIGYSHSEETKEKQRKYAKNNKHSEETKLKISNSCKGKIVSHSEETKLKISNSRKGLKHSEETKLKMRKPKGLQKKLICPHCLKEGGISNMKRYHFENCKLKIK
jgi:hypothetical protein